MGTKTDIEVLNTIYNKVEEITPGYYAIQSGNQYGVVGKNNELYVEPKYKNAVYNIKYVYLFDGADNAIIIFIPSGKRYNIHNIGYSGIMEHSAINYDIVEVKLLEKDKNSITIINSNTGDIVATYESGKVDCSIRVQNNYIIAAYEKDKVYEGITKDFKCGEVETLLKEYYKAVTKVGNNKNIKYKCITHENKEVVLNRYGQIY